jgi:hypothetical protein
MLDDCSCRENAVAQKVARHLKKVESGGDFEDLATRKPCGGTLKQQRAGGGELISKCGRG